MKRVLLLFLIVILFVTPVLGDFPAGHIIGTLVNLETQPQTNYKTLCKNNLEACLGFNLCGADSTVVHYLTRAGKEIYRGTHVKRAVDKCWQLAGNDDELRASCVGWSLHLTQDPVSHEGYTPKAIQKFLSTNLVMHPLIERKMEIKTIKASGYEADYIDNLVKTNCDIFYKDPKYLKLLNDASGLNLDNDVQIVQTALKGEGRYNSEQIWGKKIDLPSWWYYLSGGGLAIALIFFMSIVFFGRKFKILLMSIWGLISLIFGAVLISLLLGTSFIWYTALADVLSPIIPSSGLEDFIELRLKVTKDYLDSGILKVTDASGLDHYVGSTFVKGALDSAETIGFYFWTGIGLILVLALLSLTFYSIYRYFRHSKKKVSVKMFK